MGFFKEARDAFVTAWHEEFDGKDVKKEFRDAFIEGWENGWSGGSGIYENGREVSNAEMERRRRAHDEQEAAYMREQVETHRALADAGANVEAIDAARVLADARDIADGLCRARIGDAAKPCEPLIDWRPLTKSGKLPKCVARATAVWDRPNGDSVIVHMGYTADARPYTADVHIWTAGERYSYKIRTVDGELAVAGEGPA